MIADLPARKATGKRGTTPRRFPDGRRPELLHRFLANSGTFTVYGKKTGSATVSMEGTAFGGSWSVTYDNYSDDGKSFLDGTESTTQASILSGITWTAELTLTGKHSGHLSANLQIIKGRPALVPGFRHGEPEPGRPHRLGIPLRHLRAAGKARSGSRLPVKRRAGFACWLPARSRPIRSGGRCGTPRCGLVPRRVRTDRKGIAVLKGKRGRMITASAAGFTGAKARAPRPKRR